MSHGLFFALEGVDGTGKSTQIQLLCDWLKAQGREVVTCRDPGTTDSGERLRAIVLDEATTMNPRSEALVYMAARAQLVGEVIAPAIAAGKIVVSDRFLLSTIVYQGYGLDLPVDGLWQVGDFCTGGRLPDQTFVLDLDVAAAAERRTGKADRIEQRDQSYFQQLRDGFLAEAQHHPDRITVVDASQSIAEIHHQIRIAAEPLLNCS